MRDKRIMVTWGQISMKQECRDKKDETRGTGMNGGVLEM